MPNTAPPSLDVVQQALESCQHFITQADYSSALVTLNRVINLAPNDVAILCQRGRIKLLQKDFAAARGDFSEALRFNPSCASAFSGLARLHVDVGNAMEAEFNAYRALGLDPANTEAATVLRTLNPHVKIPAAPSPASPQRTFANNPSRLPASPQNTKTCSTPTEPVASAVRLDPGLTLTLGNYSYIHDSKISNPSGALTHLRIGKFCSIATDLTIIGYDHHSEWMTMYPFLDDANRRRWPGTSGIPYPQAACYGSNKSRGDITIGNDVWIGYNVKLFKGISIGNGAVIGACSLVNKSVEPYTLVAGTPARPIRKRFSDSEIAILEKTQWWDWPPEMINRHMALLCSSDFDALERAWADDQLRPPSAKPVRAVEIPAVSRNTCAHNDHPAPGACIQPPMTINANGSVQSAFLNGAGFALNAQAKRQARQHVWNFLTAGCKFFAEVKPPLLTDLHLRNSRVVPRRKDILALLPKGGVCAEIGTQTGNFAKQILSVTEPAKLHIYDLDFTPFDLAYFQEAIQQGTVELHEGDSSSLLAKASDESFDFIYIDGNHSYEGARRDLEQAAKKIKADGWIVCNDYTIYSPLEKTTYGVYRAVNEFCLEHGFEIIYLGLHQWTYHDVALRKIKPADVATVAADFGRARPVAPSVGTKAETTNSERGTTDATGVIQTIGTGDEMFTGDMAHYINVGKSALHCIESALRAAGKPKTSVRSILDLPCGHGRVMRHFKAAFPEAHFTACDLNSGAVDFCAQTFYAQPVYSKVEVNQIPLQGKFDLIWSGSLLTHLHAEACADFIRLFNSLVNPNGLIVFTLHGRWVERSLATGRYRYGLQDPDVAALLQEYYQSGFGYADYPGASGYGISLCNPAYVLSQLVALPDLKLITYHEKGWDNHQDVVCLQKQAPPDLFV